MEALVYYIFYVIAYLLSLIPLRALYILSDITYPLLNHVVKYRKKIVYENLKNAFPDKTYQERKKIANQFYKHFCDTIFETIKLLTISKKKYYHRVTYKNPGVLTELYQKKQHAIVVVGHYGNWEWLTALPKDSPYHTMAVYKPLNNKRFDNLLIKMRSRFGTEMVPMRQTIKAINRYHEEKKYTLSCFIGDQSPVWEEVQYWTEFLNQNTPVYLGIEKISRKTRQAVLFYNMQKTKRGHYEVEIIKLSDDASKTQPYEITEKHVKLLERIIKNRPELWLWTHRRWKLTKKKLEKESLKNSA
ncbi:MAG: lysophospholipid acyltransferase family protein [Bacteroidota bacterium]